MKSTSNKVAIYMRLSRDDGDDRESESITNQRKIIYDFIENNKEEKFIVVDEYIDDGYTGTNFERPDFKRLIKDIEKGKINCVITKDLSRFGRDHIMSGYYLENYFREKSLRYIAINDNMDSNNEDSFDMISFKLSFNDYYPRDISKKIKKVKNMKAHKGEYQASQAPFGYIKSKMEKNKLIINSETAPIVKMIFDLYLAGNGTREIVKILYKKGIKTPAQYSNKKQYMKGNEFWQRSYIIKLLKNQTYTGAVVSHTTSKVSYKVKKCIRVPEKEWIIVENMHEPIISKEKFNEVQELMKSRTSVRKRKHDHILKGFIKCGHCGGSMTIKPDSRTSGTVRLNFICTNRNTNKMNCDNSVISANIVLNEVLKNIRQHCKEICFDEDNMKAILKKIEQELNIENRHIEQELKELQQKIEKLDIQIKITYEDKLNGILSADDFLKIYKDKNEEREKIKKEIEKVEMKLETEKNKNIVEYRDLIKYANEFLEMKSPSKEIISRLVDKIIICKGRKITIKYKFSKT